MNMTVVQSDLADSSSPAESLSSESVEEELEELSMSQSSDVVEEGSQEDGDGSDDSYKEVKDQPPCEFCGQVLCDAVVFWDDICEICDDLKDNGMEYNQVRFHAYREYTRLKHGVLRRHDRRPLPMCVRLEILDSWPDPNGSYVGFQAAIKHAADDSD
jgi:hypothetical protein